jgi:hypothetical protein
MILLCIRIKTPLFLIGKNDSSKSLAKTLIAKKMLSLDRTNSAILRHFKKASLITFTSVFFLDEICLAETSSSIPVKALIFSFFLDLRRFF